MSLRDTIARAWSCLSEKKKNKWRYAAQRATETVDGKAVHVDEPELSFAEMRTANAARCREWHPGFPENRDGWTGSDWSNAMAGECGEACNVVKKLGRKDFALAGAVDPDRDVLVAKLAEEIADTILYADLLATYYGIDLAAAVPAKFNAISVREGFPHRMREVSE